MTNNDSRDRKITLSEVLQNNIIIETIYDPKRKETDFVISDGTNHDVNNLCKNDNGQFLRPFMADSDLLTSNFLRLPSGIKDYESIESLFYKIRDYIDKYVHLPDNFKTISALYVMMTWVYDRFDTIPYLRVIGNYGTGKTRFLNVIGNLCYKAMMAGGSITTAATFRTLDQIQGTLVFDEADFRSSEIWSEIVKILNSGHTKNFPVIRMNVSNKKDGYETKSFKVYGPKILASRERFGDEALESRSLTQIMHPIIDSSKPIHYNSNDLEAEDIKNQLLVFRLKCYLKIEPDETTVQELEFPRLKQSALALTTIAKFIGLPEIMSESIEFLKEYEKELTLSQQTDVKADVLLCIATMLNESETPYSKIRIGRIATMFDQKFYNEYSDKETKEYDNGLQVKGYRVSARKIGVYVRKLGIRTERDGYGFYIPMPQEAEKIKNLVNRYGLKTLIENEVKDKIEERKKDKETDSLF